MSTRNGRVETNLNRPSLALDGRYAWTRVCWPSPGIRLSAQSRRVPGSRLSVVDDDRGDHANGLVRHTEILVHARDVEGAAEGRWPPATLPESHASAPVG